MPILVAVLLLIQQATPTLTPAATEAHDPLKLWVQVGSISGALIGLFTFLTKGLPWIKAKLDRRSIQTRIGAESYTSAGLENAFRNFVPPMCQDVDPSGGDEPRNVYGVKQPLFGALDDALSNPEANKYFILLADSGMGKTTALLNYYLRHIRRWMDPGYKLVLIPLNIANADERIASVPDKENTVLFLDALDEDTLAIVDYVERLRILLNATQIFRAVLISCRTQFFSKDEEIPKETGRIKITDRRAGQEAEYFFQKIYLSPFNDAQVERYIKRKYRVWRKERKLAFQVAKKIPHLTARPMLLAHIDDLLKSKKEFRYSFELYEAMVEAWLRRERGLVKEIDALRQFSEMLAVDLYVKRAERNAEKIPRNDLLTLAKKWDIGVDDWKLSGRSLLNRDADGNYKFAHRSVMEYLFVRRFLAADSLTASTEWTDQMYLFLYEYMLKYSTPGPDGSSADTTWEGMSSVLNPARLSYLIKSAEIAKQRVAIADQASIARMGAYFINRFLDDGTPRGCVVRWTRLRQLTLDNMGQPKTLIPLSAIMFAGDNYVTVNYTKSTVFVKYWDGALNTYSDVIYSNVVFFEMLPDLRLKAIKEVGKSFLWPPEVEPQDKTSPIFLYESGNGFTLLQFKVSYEMPFQYLVLVLQLFVAIAR